MCMCIFIVASSFHVSYSQTVFFAVVLFSEGLKHSHVLDSFRETNAVVVYCIFFYLCFSDTHAHQTCIISTLSLVCVVFSGKEERIEEIQWWMKSQRI